MARKQQSANELQLITTSSHNNQVNETDVLIYNLLIC